DAPQVYKHLLDPSVRRKNTDERLAKMRYSMSLVVAYFGTNRTYPELAHHTILLGPRYRELLDDIFRKKVLAPDFSLYLHAPTRTIRSPARTRRERRHQPYRCPGGRASGSAGLPVLDSHPLEELLSLVAAVATGGPTSRLGALRLLPAGRRRGGRRPERSRSA